MSRRIEGVFKSREDLLSALQAAAAKGLTVADVKTPYPLPEANSSLGLHRSRLPRFCFLLGLLGAVAKIWFEFWTSSVDWPVNVGGKPWNSLPAFIPVTFEVMVLVAGVSTVGAFLVSRRLFPGKVPSLSSTRGEFVLTVASDGTADGMDEARSLLMTNGACQIIDDREELP